MKALEKLIIAVPIAILFLLGNLVLVLYLTDTSADNRYRTPNILEKNSGDLNLPTIKREDNMNISSAFVSHSKNDNAKQEEPQNEDKGGHPISHSTDKMLELRRKIEELRGKITQWEINSLKNKKYNIDIYKCVHAMRKIDRLIFGSTLDDYCVPEEAPEMINKCLDIIRTDENIVLKSLLALIVGQIKNNEQIVETFMGIIREKPSKDLEVAFLCGLIASSPGDMVGRHGAKKWSARLSRIREALGASRSTLSNYLSTGCADEARLRVKSNDVRDALVEVAEGDYSLQTRIFAMESLLNELGEEEVVNVLKNIAVYDPFMEIREAAVIVMGVGCRPNDIMPELEIISQSDSSEEVKKAAKSALERLKSKSEK